MVHFPCLINTIVVSAALIFLFLLECDFSADDHGAFEDWLIQVYCLRPYGL